MSKIRITRSVAALGIFLLLAILTALFVRPIAQNESYHAFADSRTIWGVPNFWNVISNIPFAAIGILGIRNAQRLEMRVLFAGVFLTCLGSAYYHCAPSDGRLIWDRLPMTIVFMSLVAYAFGEERSAQKNLWLLCVLLFCGIASVFWWQAKGDLRPYALVQFGPALLLPLSPVNKDRGRYLAAIFALYTLAKLAEHFDGLIYEHFWISGHAWKHILAAIASYFILSWSSATKDSGHSKFALRNLDNVELSAS